MWRFFNTGDDCLTGNHGEGSVSATSPACSRNCPGAGDLTAAHHAVQGQGVDGGPRGSDHVMESARNLAVEVPADRERPALRHRRKNTGRVVHCYDDAAGAQGSATIDREVGHKPEYLIPRTIQGRVPGSIDIAGHSRVRSAPGKCHTRG